MAFRNPYIIDMDSDGKKNILLAGAQRRIAVDWEQTSAGILDKKEPGVADCFQLHANFPNPFNRRTIIQYVLEITTDIEIQVFNLAGEGVFSLSKENVFPGNYAQEWDASESSSGLYFIRLVTAEGSQTKKAVLIK